MMNESTWQQTWRRGFGAAFLAAMHDWRQRQAAREIEYYQHLIHKPRVHEGWLSAGGPPRNPRIPNLHPGHNSSTKRRARVRAQTILGDRETTRGSIWAKFRGAFVRWLTINLPTKQLQQDHISQKR